ncbi:MAG: acyltransferase [Nitrolancea sp.]
MTGYRKTHAEMTDTSRSPLRRYQQIVVGSTSLGYTIKYEVLTGLLGGMPGAIGLLLRSKLYPPLFKSVGRGVVFGKDVTLRHPSKISIGDAVVVGDGVSLEARGDARSSITIGNNVVIGEQVSIGCKYGVVRIGDYVNISEGAHLRAIHGNTLEVGDYALIAPFTYIGGVRYHTERTDIPIVQQGLDPRGGTRIGRGAWLGTRSIVLDGTSVGDDAIVGAGAIVNRDVPAFAVAVGVPAKVIRMRSRDDLADTQGMLNGVAVSRHR